MKRAKGTYARVPRCNPVIKFFPLPRPRILFSNSSISSIYLNVLLALWIRSGNLDYFRNRIKDSSVFSLEISFVVFLFRLVFEREKKKRKSEEIAIARFSSTTILNVNNANKMGLKWERNLLVGGSVNWRRMQVF